MVNGAIFDLWFLGISAGAALVILAVRALRYRRRRPWWRA